MRNYLAKMKRQIISPACDLNIPLFSKVLYECWPKDIFNTVEGPASCKFFYDKSYKVFQKELEILISKYHPAAWVREAYIQLEVWSVILYGHVKTKYQTVKGPKKLAPIGRYGWRYILEMCLEQTENSKIEDIKRPIGEDSCSIFTILLGLSYCSEVSNYLHYLPNTFSSVKIKFDPSVFLKFPSLNEKEEKTKDSIMEYMAFQPDWNKYPDFSVSSDLKLMKMINDFLEENFGFNIKEVEDFSVNIIARISNHIGASIIVDSFEGFTELCSELSDFPHTKVKKLLGFILLDVKNKKYVKRDFLVKSQLIRMMNYAGAVIRLNNCLETIYSPEAAKYDSIKDAEDHIILTPTLIGEWVDNLITRILYGQRGDLKELSEKIKIDLSKIEEYFHKNIFEEAIRKMLRRRGFSCDAFKKLDGRELECGEIDILAYNIKFNTLLIIEVKNYAPPKDAKAMGQIMSDHFKQKRYHFKFIRKIEYVKHNIEKFLEALNIKYTTSPTIESYYITSRGSIIRYLITEYLVYPFYDFENVINLKYGD